MKENIKKYYPFAVLFALGFVCALFFIKPKEVEVIKNVTVTKEVPVLKEVEKEVEKIVYKDSQYTLDQLAIHRDAGCLFGESYLFIFDLVKDLMDAYNSPIHQDWIDVNSVALEYSNNYCK